MKCRALSRGPREPDREQRLGGALSIYNFGTYRTGNFVSPTQVDNDGPFEVIDVGTGTFAIDMGQMAFVDLRQILITGDSFVGRQSMLQNRGDSRGPNMSCSLFDGCLTGTGIFAQVRLQFTHVTGTIVGTVSGGSTPTSNCYAELAALLTLEGRIPTGRNLR